MDNKRILVPPSIKDIQAHLERSAYSIIAGRSSESTQEFYALEILSMPEEIFDAVQSVEKTATSLYSSSPYNPPYTGGEHGSYTKIVAVKCVEPMLRHIETLCPQLVTASVYFAVVCAAIKYAINRRMLYSPVPVIIPDHCFDEIKGVLLRTRLNILFDKKLDAKTLYKRECCAVKEATSLMKGFRRFVSSSKGSRLWNVMNWKEEKSSKRKQRYLKRLYRSASRMLQSLLRCIGICQSFWTTTTGFPAGDLMK